MANSQFQNAAREAQSLLSVYSPNKPARFAAPGAEVLQPEITIKQALAEAQYILNQTSTTALRNRISALAGIRRKQRIINGLHLVTGSGFVLLIADLYPDPIKWVGAILSLGAGILSLVLPGDPATIERQVFEDTNTVAALSGEIARIQTELLFKKAEGDEHLSGEIATLIGKCIELSRKYELDQIAAAQGFFPRPKEETTTAKDSHQ